LYVDEDRTTPPRRHAQQLPVFKTAKTFFGAARLAFGNAGMMLAQREQRGLG